MFLDSSLLHFVVFVVMEITLINGYFKHFTLECPPQTTQLHRGWFSFLFFWWKLLSLLRVDGWLLWHPVIAFPRIESLKEGLMNCWIFLLFSTQQVLWFQPSKFSSIECSCWSTGRATVSKTLSKSSQSIPERCSLRGFDSPSRCPSLNSSPVFSAGGYQHTSWCSHLLPSPGNAKPHRFLLCSLCFLPSHKGVLRWRNSHIQNVSSL